MALNPKQRLFADGIIAGKSATDAAKDAGYSADTAYSQGSRLLKNAEIQQAVQQAATQVTARVIETTAITKAKVLNELAALVFFDPRKLFGEDGAPKSIYALDDETAKAVAGVTVLEVFEGTGPNRVFVGHEKKYQLVSKLGAIDKAMRHLGLLKDQEITVNVSLADRLRKARERAKPPKQ